MDERVRGGRTIEERAWGGRTMEEMVKSFVDSYTDKELPGPVVMAGSQIGSQTDLFTNCTKRLTDKEEQDWREKKLDDATTYGEIQEALFGTPTAVDDNSQNNGNSQGLS